MSSLRPPVLHQLHCIDRSKSGFSDELNDVLNDEEYQRCVPELQGDHLVWLVDSLDKALDGLDPSNRAFRKCLRELRSICSTRGILPTSYTISSDLLKVGPNPSIPGGFGDVYEGSLDNSSVSIKRVRIYDRDGPEKATKAFCQEAVVWKRLTHQNILPLLGVTLVPLQLVSSWMTGGDLQYYIKKYPDADRLGLLFDLAKGLCYLHSCGVVHGDLKGARSSSKYHFIILTPGQPNVLVDDSGHIRIGDFGLATVTRNLDSSRSASNHLSHTPRWAAPEILGGGKPSKEADVFSFAMVTIEIFTGAIPFVNEITVTAMLFTVQGKRPPRPLHPTFTEDLWTLIQCCWDQEPFSRPKISEVALQLLTLSVCNRLTGHTLTTHDHVSLIEAIFLGDDRVQIESVPREGAQTLIDVIDEALGSLTPETRRRCLRFLYRICGHQVLLPRSLAIPLCYVPTENPLYRDEFGDVWKGHYGGREVAAKVLRVYSPGDLEKTTKRFCREVVAWKVLQHLNILPLLGVTMTDNRFVMVSEWMGNGNVNEFVKAHSDVDRLELLRDTTKGLVYMHDQGIIHGNLKGINVLIDNNGRARLADFGLLTILSDDPTIMSTAIGAAAAQWMSPELLAPEKFGSKKSHPTRASDRYALGMVIYEVLSGQTPFSQCLFVAVVQKVLAGERPKRPHGAQGTQFTDAIWGILELCWQPQPGDRINAKDVLRGLEGKPYPLRPSDESGSVEMDVDDESGAASDGSESTTHGLVVGYHAKSAFKVVIRKLRRRQRA